LTTSYLDNNLPTYLPDWLTGAFTAVKIHVEVFWVVRSCR